ncbi:hypothetical protein KY332_03935 [Candidatus Woesearchaeota archaeon]|nr:hypothetical protein [Candidatus Woesearchaeota archaeon]
MNDKSELKKKLNICKTEINRLRKTLNQLDDQKEAWFKKKEEYSKDISKLIGRVKGSKRTRDKYTKEVKVSKEKRKELNDRIRAKIEEFKKLNIEKRDIQKKYGIKEDPSIIKKQIEKLDFVIEHEGVSFDKEKKLMKEIKELKKKLGESGKASDIFERANKVSKEIDELKEEAEGFHKEVQTKAKESQEKHEEIIGASREVDELRKKEEGAFRKFVEFKKKFVEANDGLQEKLIEVSKLNIEFGKERKSVEAKKKEVKHKKLKKKEDIVKEKLKKGGKLTTEDLLIMQELDK